MNKKKYKFMFAMDYRPLYYYRYFCWALKKNERKLNMWGRPEKGYVQTFVVIREQRYDFDCYYGAHKDKRRSEELTKIMRLRISGV